MTTTAAWAPSRVLDRRMLTKVPEVTAFFWIIKLLTTAGGESVADLLSMDLIGMKPALLLTGGLLAVALAVQLSLRRYVVPVYWTVVVLVGIAGTLITDYIVQTLGVSKPVATGGFLLALLATFGLWQLTEHTLSIHSITTTRRELFYWTAVMLTFSLGTAAGDLTAFSWGWRFLPSILLFGAIFVAAGTAHLRFGLNAVLCFWLAYVLTRPLGASVADYLAFDRSIGALGFGLAAPSIGFGAAIVALVGYLTVSRRDVPADGPDSAGPSATARFTG
jgi:uncharacterized membrane-anchored protein